MGVPYNGSPMAQHPQYLTVRNSRGREMIDVLGSELIRTPAVDTGDRRPLVMQVCACRAEFGGGGGREMRRYQGLSTTVRSTAERVWKERRAWGGVDRNST
jgi:hypothetical protein